MPLVTAREPGTTTALAGMMRGSIGGGAKDVAIDEIEDRSAAGEDGARREHSAGANDGAFVDAAVAADEDVVFNHDGTGVDGLENAADLGGGAEVNALCRFARRSRRGRGSRPWCLRRPMRRC